MLWPKNANGRSKSRLQDVGHEVGELLEVVDQRFLAAFLAARVLDRQHVDVGAGGGRDREVERRRAARVRGSRPG